jgi:hypothetical protein
VNASFAQAKKVMTSGPTLAISLAVVSLAAAQNGGKGVSVLPQDPTRFVTEKKLALESLSKRL